MSKVNVYLYGRHSNRTPLSYIEYQLLFRHSINLVDSVERADVIVVGYSVDLVGFYQTHGSTVRSLPDLKVLVLSEEPLWDLISANDPVETKASVMINDENYNFTVANFFNSPIFSFQVMPYFITTESKYCARYAYEFTDLMQNFDAKEMLRRWRNCEKKIGFLQQRRTNEVHYAEKYGYIALSGYRTSLAEYLDTAEVRGLGWGKEAPRQTLQDWHLDKILRYKRKFTLFSSLENTLVRNYVTEKVFDAFAMCSFPVYYADPEHRIFDLVEQDSFLNLHSYSEEAAANLISDWSPTDMSVEKYFNSIKSLNALFCDPGNLMLERERVVSETMKQITKVLN